MPRKPMNLNARTFGFYTVLEKHPSNKKNSMWLCSCICGNLRIVEGASLVRNMSTSCGCQKSALLSRSATTHGMSHSHLYQVHRDMLDRAYKIWHPSYDIYSPTGVDPKWHTFAPFAQWSLSNGYIPYETVLRRKDPSLSFSPSNCYWKGK
jgi:hypothetical protein